MILQASYQVRGTPTFGPDPCRAGGDSIALLKLEDIHKVYTRGAIDVPVLRGVSLSIARREMVALMGVSGSGKTTLINLLGFLDRPTSGRQFLDHRDVTHLGETERAWLRSREIGFVFQNFNLLPRMTALENVMMPSVYGSHGFSERECRARARALLERVGLGARVDHEPSRLSGGEQQRVAIARALMNRCSLLIADEPTGNLDSKTGEEILRLFRQLNTEDGLTVILVTHDPNVAGHADRIIRVRDGLVFDDDCFVDLTPKQHNGAESGKTLTGFGVLSPINDPGRDGRSSNASSKVRARRYAIFRPYNRDGSTLTQAQRDALRSDHAWHHHRRRIAARHRRDRQRGMVGDSRTLDQDRCR